MTNVPPLLRPLDACWTLIRSVISPSLYAVANACTDVARTLLGPHEVYDVIEPGPGGSYKIVSAHPNMKEALIVLEVKQATNPDVSVMADVDVQRHNREAAMRVYRAGVQPGVALPRREPGATLVGGVEPLPDVER